MPDRKQQTNENSLAINFWKNIASSFTSRALRRPPRAAADNLLAPPLTFVDRRAAADNLTGAPPPTRIDRRAAANTMMSAQGSSYKVWRWVVPAEISFCALYDKSSLFGVM